MPSQLDRIISQTGCEILMKRTFPVRHPAIQDLPQGLHPNVKLITNKRFPGGLFCHQVEAVAALLAGKHVGLTTSTASGKSAAFVIPILDAMYRDKKSRALYISPLKALGNDQLRKFEQWKMENVVARFDGDTNSDQRREFIRTKRLLISTPDVLHTTLLRENNKEFYRDFFANLTHVVFDECHIYTGAFGSHVAMLIRRLRQVCQNHDANPQFILASATVGNAASHMENLSGLKDVFIIDEEHNGSPLYEKDLYFVKRPQDKWNPLFVTNLLAKLAEQEQKFIVFCDSRREVESIISEAWRKLPQLENKIMPYRSGYEAADRTNIEKGLAQGSLLGVVSTSALEMGIDIPDLGVCVMLGVPSSKISMLQRMGRVGRSRPGDILIVAADSAYDSYFCRNPQQLLERPLEDLTINLSNRIILLSHYACARAEAATFGTPRFDPAIFTVEFLRLARHVNDFECTEDILYDQQPHFKVAIRAIDDPIFQIKEDLFHGNENPSIGTINYSQLLREAYPGAIYGHRGRKYRVKRIAHAGKEVLVYPQLHVLGSTVPMKELYIKERAIQNPGLQRSWPSMTIQHTSLGITEKVNGYIEKGGKTKKEEIYPQPLIRYFPTSGLVIHMNGISGITHGAIVGLCAALGVCYPIFARCSQEDIGVYGWSKDRQTANLYLYDNVVGGLGLTLLAGEHFSELIDMVYGHIAGCECGQSEDAAQGCIYCVRGNPWLTYPKENTRNDTLTLLAHIREVITLPETSPRRSSVAKPSVTPSAVPGVFGRNMIVAGSVVYTAMNEEGTVLDSEPFIDSMFYDRQYTIRIGNDVKRFLGQKLKLISGGLERWCVNCSAESIDLDETNCPTCGARLV